MKLSRRQIYLFLACVAPIGKLVVLPTELVREAKNDLLLPVAIHFLVQAAVIFCVLLLGRRERGLYEILEGTFGRVFAKICMVTLSLFLLLAGLVPLIEQQLFVQGVFYDTLPSLAAFAPYFVFSVYLCAKPLGSQGRVWDILGPIAIAGLAGILVLSVGETDLGALLPLGGGGMGTFKALPVLSGWLFDGAVLLMLLGRIDYKKGTAWKGTLWYLAGALGVLLFLAVFYGVFGDVAVNQPFAIAKTSKYFSGITVLGRIDYIFIYALSLVMAFWCAMPLQAGIDCFLQPFGRERHLATILSVAVNAVFLALMYFLDNRFGEVLHFVTGAPFWIFVVFCTVLPPLSLLLRRDHERS